MHVTSAALASPSESPCSRRSIDDETPSPLPTVAMLTPWEQRCGNAEYAQRLAVGLRQIATIEPIELFNFIDPEKPHRRRDIEAYLDGLVRQIDESAADIVHIQHEYCFFGRSIRDSNRNFDRLMQRIKQPKVVSLHTYHKSMVARRRRRRFSVALEYVRLFSRTRVMRRALESADAIVLHGKHTQQQFNAVFRTLKKRCHVIPFPVEPVTDRVAPRIAKPAGDVWIAIPGFVTRYKGHPHAVRALPHLPASFKLVVAGGPHPKDKQSLAYWVELLQAIDAEGLQDRVIFTGFLAGLLDQAAVLGQVDIFLLPYDEVGQSGSAVLADVLAYDRPVVTSHAQSMFVYRHDRDTTFSSISVDVSDEQLLAKTLLSACHEDEAFAVCRGHRATVRERHSLTRTRDAYDTIYRSLLRKDA